MNRKFVTDESYLNWQKRFSEQSWFRRFWVFWGIYSVGLVFIVAFYFLSEGQYKPVVLAFLAFILGRLIISPLIYLIYKKSRPYQRLNFTTFHSWVFSPSTKLSTSFPSDHAISLMAISTVLIYYFPPLVFLLGGICILNGWGRVMLGYHYIEDILAGWLVGFICGLTLIYWVAPVLFTH